MHHHSLLSMVGTTQGASKVEQHLQEYIHPIFQRSGSSQTAGVGKAYVYLIFVDRLLAKYLDHVVVLWNATKGKKGQSHKAGDPEYMEKFRKYAWSKLSTSQ